MLLYIKALHIIFIVTWFSAIFYLVRLFVYNREAQDKQVLEKQILSKQFNIMIQRLLFGIAWPSAILTLILGITLLYLYNSFPVWLFIKMGFVFILFMYQLSLHKIYTNQKKSLFKYSSTQLRLWNEVPTILLFAIIFLVVVKQGISLVYGFLGLITLASFIMAGIKIYKNFRKRD
tara:strand:- start:136 stop:663 length:528 start_codon:yes stop_codon:yes gene_type:complete